MNGKENIQFTGKPISPKIIGKFKNMHIMKKRASTQIRSRNKFIESKNINQENKIHLNRFKLRRKSFKNY